MKTKSGILAVALAMASVSFAGAQTSTWKFDPAHTAAEFTVRHMAISNVHGRFGNVTGTVTLDDKDITKSSVNATIDATTVDTGVPQRDAHLKSPDFFDVAKYPTMTFVSKSIAKKDGKLVLAGELTLHGVTKSVTLDVEGPSKPQTDGKGGVHSGFSATTSIHRQDYGLTWGGNLASGDPMVGDDVKVELEVEMVKQ